MGGGGGLSAGESLIPKPPSFHPIRHHSLFGGGETDAPHKSKIKRHSLWSQGEKSERKGNGTSLLGGTAGKDKAEAKLRMIVVHKKRAQERNFSLCCPGEGRGGLKHWRLGGGGDLTPKPPPPSATRSPRTPLPMWRAPCCW